MEREIIEIDEELCVGCGNCVPNCHQGALQIIDGKARLISDLMCEGLGACVGHCPTGAMTIQKREAERYDEARVMEKIIAGGPNVVRAHLEHLIQHGQHAYLAEAREILRERGLADLEQLAEDPEAAGLAEAAEELAELAGLAAPVTVSVAARAAHPLNGQAHAHAHGPSGGGCPGSAARSFGPPRASASLPPAADAPHAQASELRQWPVQLHLLNPGAAYFQRADVLLAADCTAFAAGGFHSGFLRGKTLAIACPKLDQNLESYVGKLVMMVEEAMINTLTVLVMEVPCCGGLVQIARAALQQASRTIPLKVIVLSVDGEIVQEEWVTV